MTGRLTRPQADHVAVADGDRGQPAAPRGTGNWRSGNWRSSSSRSGSWRSGLRRAIRIGSRPGPWRRGHGLAALAVALGLVMALHGQIPNRGVNLGSLAETFLPWSGLLIPVLLAAALARRSTAAATALLLPALVWLHLFGGQLGDRSRPGGDLTLVSENVDAGNPDPAGTARDLAASGADLLALEELTPQATAVYERGLAAAYPYHVVLDTVGLWSRLPLSGTRPADLTMYSPTRALRTTVATERGPLTVYVAHLWSVRVNPRAGFSAEQRNIGADALGRIIDADPSKRVVLLGDLNGSTGDRALRPLTARLRSAQDVAGDGFGFSWPAFCPLVRIDQILVTGVQPDSSRVLPANGSDHRPVQAAISWLAYTICMADPITFRPTAEDTENLAILTADGTTPTRAIRHALEIAAHRKRQEDLRADAARLAANPEYQAEIRAVREELDELRAW